MFKLFKYLKKYWWATLLAPLFMVGEVGMDMLITQQMQKMIDGMNNIFGYDGRPQGDKR